MRASQFTPEAKAPVVEKQLTQCSDQDLQKLLGKGKLGSMIRHPWFQEYRNYSHAYKHGVSSAGFTTVEVYSYFPGVNVTPEGKVRPLIMVSFTFSYSGTKVIQAYKYYRDKEPNDNEKRMGPQAGWKHFKTWKDEEDAVEKAWDRHNTTTNESESYQPPQLNVGDKILKGKFKNSPAEIKGFKKDKHNQPVLKTNKGDVQLFKPRVTKLMKEDYRSTKYDFHREPDNWFVATADGEEIGRFQGKSQFDSGAAQDAAKKCINMHRADAANKKNAEDERRYQFEKPLSDTEKRWVLTYHRLYVENEQGTQKEYDNLSRWAEVVRKSISQVQSPMDHPLVKEFISTL